MQTLTKPKAGSRRKVLPDQTPKEVEAATNGLDAESFLVWVGKLRQENALFDLARKRRDKVRKLAKNSGMEMGILDRVLKDADKDPDIVLKGMATYKQYSEWMDAPGKQFSLFDLPNSAMLTHAEREAKAKRAGYADGLLGKTADTQAYAPDHEFHQVYMQQWHDGQRILLERIHPIEIAIESDGKSQESQDQDEPLDEAA